ncbi:MAG: type II toxin-antitoxin system RelE/ParE family toxin [Magnetococcales bacterium]|nr:type II toxin-antitoxin system RelE/ParE family toxin [Magnetococcales bacterium]
MEHRIGNTVAETASFDRQAAALWSESEIDELKSYLAINPMAGDEIQGTGGLRKLRWSRSGMGKRGGARVIYYFYDDFAPVYLLWAYAKGQQEDLSSREKAVLAKAAEILKAALKARRST